jgi:hypothetical protein
MIGKILSYKILSSKFRKQASIVPSVGADKALFEYRQA